MLDLIAFNDDINIHSTTVDAWGISVDGDAAVTVKGNIRPVFEYKEMMNQKNKSVVVSCTIGVGADVNIKASDVVGFMLDGEYKKFEVLGVKPLRDFGGNILYKKVWV